MKVEQLKVGLLDNFAYIIWEADCPDCAVIDPGTDCSSILDEINERGLTLRFIINTHSHFDHIGCNEWLRSRTGAIIVAHAASSAPRKMSVKDGDTLEMGGSKMKFIHTPGHSPDSMCVLADNCLFTGDTLFVGDCGRVDLPGGDPEALHHSFFEKILPLDDSITVYPGHDYGKERTSTVGRERRNNYTLKTRNLEEFTKFMMG